MSSSLTTSGIPPTSEAMIELLEVMERAAAFRSSVLLTGERGTGKEVIARAIHAQSPRRQESFVAARSAAPASEPFAQELFGGLGNRPGLACEADRGTLYLDDVADLSRLGAKTVEHRGCALRAARQGVDAAGGVPGVLGALAGALGGLARLLVDVPGL